MAIRTPDDPVARRSLHRVLFTYDKAALGMAVGSTGAAYLVEGPRGNGFTAYFDQGHPQVFASTAAVDTFIDVFGTRA